jgi:mono/diheme cytochrome c family protein
LPLKFWCIQKSEKEWKMTTKLSAITILLTLFISACGTATPQATPEPATATATLLSPTNTQAPSTETAVPATDAPATATEIPAANDGVSFASDVLPIFQATCIKCHGGDEIKEGLNLTTYDGVIAGSFNGPVIHPGDSNDSYLVRQIIDGEMPKRGPKLTDEQIQTITDWVNQGALNN